MENDFKTSIKSLPPLAESVAKIQEICDDPEAGIGGIAVVVEKDPMLTANLLKAANSPLYGFSREIHNVSQAVSLFGMATVKGFALASAVRSSMTIDLSPYGLSVDEFSRISQMHNALMNHWYKKVKHSMLSVLSPASFLLGVGKILIAGKIIENGKTQEFLEKTKTAPSSTSVEEEYFQVNSSDVAAAIFDHWKLEPEMVEAIKYSTHPEKADEHIRDFAVALQVVKTAIPFHEKFSEKTVKKALEIVKHYGLEEKTFLDAIEHLEK